VTLRFEIFTAISCVKIFFDATTLMQ